MDGNRVPHQCLLRALKSAFCRISRSCLAFFHASVFPVCGIICTFTDVAIRIAVLTFIGATRLIRHRDSDSCTRTCCCCRYSVARPARATSRLHAFVDEPWHIAGLAARLGWRPSQKRLHACLRAFRTAWVLGYGCPGHSPTVWPAWAIAFPLTFLLAASTSTSMTIFTFTMAT